MKNLSRSTRSLFLASALVISSAPHAFAFSGAVEAILSGAQGLQRLETLMGSQNGSKQLEKLLLDAGVPSSRAQAALKDPAAAREALSKGLAARANDADLEARVSSLLGDSSMAQWKADAAAASKPKKAEKGDVAKLLGNGKGKISLAADESALSPREKEVFDVATHLQAEGKATGELVAGFRAAVKSDANVLEVVGEGFTKGCAEMQPMAVNNLMTSYVETAGRSDVAAAVRASLQKTTRVDEGKARQRTCALAAAPCKLYGRPVQEACSAGAAF